MEHDLRIIPVLNKIDLPGAMIEEMTDEIMQLTGCEKEDIILASAKEGIGIEEILNRIVEAIPAPTGDPDGPLKALIFDSVFNPFRGTIAYFRVFDGSIHTKEHVKFMATNAHYYADEIGILKLEKEPKDIIKAGDVGYIISGIKEVREIKVGDTITSFDNPSKVAVQGFKEVKPMVFAGIYPVDTEEFEDLRYSLEKLKLNDASLVFEPETSLALGFGFRTGFLGMLHMEIIQERLEREFNMTVITTVPNVEFIATMTNGEVLEVNNPSDLPDPTKTAYLEEPFIKAQIISKSDYIGNIIKLCMDKRGIFKNQNYLTTDRVELIFELPLAEVVFDFFDKLKTVSKGYASFDYEIIGFRESSLVKMDIMLNGEPVDALSAIIHRGKAEEWGRKLCVKLKELIPRQQFDIAIQAGIGAKIIARETVKALRKDVTAKCYGGDISRKRKLLEKQKKGKKRMRQVGNVEVPQSAFMAVLKLD
jgi:GTP-binding protein LepA